MPGPLTLLYIKGFQHPLVAEGLLIKVRVMPDDISDFVLVTPEDKISTLKALAKDSPLADKLSPNMRWHLPEDPKPLRESATVSASGVEKAGEVIVELGAVIRGGQGTITAPKEGPATLLYVRGYQNPKEASGITVKVKVPQAKAEDDVVVQLEDTIESLKKAAKSGPLADILKDGMNWHLPDQSAELADKKTVQQSGIPPKDGIVIVEEGAVIVGKDVKVDEASGITVKVKVPQAKAEDNVVVQLEDTIESLKKAAKSGPLADILKDSMNWHLPDQSAELADKKTVQQSGIPPKDGIVIVEEGAVIVGKDEKVEEQERPVLISGAPSVVEEKPRLQQPTYACFNAAAPKERVLISGFDSTIEQIIPVAVVSGGPGSIDEISHPAILSGKSGSVDEIAHPAMMSGKSGSVDEIAHPAMMSGKSGSVAEVMPPTIIAGAKSTVKEIPKVELEKENHGDKSAKDSVKKPAAKKEDPKKTHTDKKHKTPPKTASGKTPAKSAAKPTKKKRR
ncbi:MAG: uncharacterized protein KVP18_000965 [Porospora cf. gigantea A]|nr:MAG: hypothetical protein KVP18_000965 [Porospora cf. gigantea A]